MASTLLRILSLILHMMTIEFCMEEVFVHEDTSWISGMNKTLYQLVGNIEKSGPTSLL